MPPVVRGRCGRVEGAADPLEVSVEHQGVVSELPAGFQVLNTPARSTWALAPAVVPSVATSVAAPSPSGAQPRNTQTQLSGTSSLDALGPSNGDLTAMIEEELTRLNATESLINLSQQQWAQHDTAEALLDLWRQETKFD